MLITNIRPLDPMSKESDGKWDYEVTVRDTETERTFGTKVSGGYQVCEYAVKSLKEMF